MWAATRTDSERESALKILNTTKAHREPYLRFVREINFLKDLKDPTGILPMLNSHLPDTPTSHGKGGIQTRSSIYINSL